MSLNKQQIIGNLADDATIRSVSAERDVINFRVITNYEYQTAEGTVSEATGHNVVRFAEKGKLNGLAGLLKKGAGVYVEGRTVIKKNGEHLNIHIDATQNYQASGIIDIVKYVTERPQQADPQQQGGYQQAPQQQGGYQQAAPQHQGGYQQAPQQAAPQQREAAPQQREAAPQHQGGYQQATQQAAPQHQGRYQQATQQAAPQQREAAPQPGPNFDDFDDDIPF